MIFLKRLKGLFFSAALIASLLLSNTTNANTIDITNATTNNVEIVNVSSGELEYNFYEGIFYEDLFEIEDRRGKFKDAWKAFWKGFVEGFTGEYEDLANPGSGGGISQGQINDIQNFASAEIQTEENFYNLLYDIDNLLLTSATEPGRAELLPLFNNNQQIVDIFNDGGGDSDEPQAKINWRKVGRVVGVIAKVLLVGLCC